MGGDGGRDKVRRYRVWELGFQQQTDPRSSGGGGWEGDPDQTWLLWKGLNLDAGNILGFAQRQGRRDIYVFALGLYRLFFSDSQSWGGRAGGGRTEKTFTIAQV